MKKLLPLVISLLISSAIPTTLLCASKPATKHAAHLPNKKDTPHQANSPQDDDEDEKVVLTAFANMLNSFGKIATNPHNPAVVAPCVTSMMASFVSVLLHILRDTSLRNNKIIMGYIQDYFEKLPKEEHTEIVSLIVSKAFEFANEQKNNNEPLVLESK